MSYGSADWNVAQKFGSQHLRGHNGCVQLDKLWSLCLQPALLDRGHTHQPQYRRALYCHCKGAAGRGSYDPSHGRHGTVSLTHRPFGTVSCAAPLSAPAVGQLLQFACLFVHPSIRRAALSSFVSTCLHIYMIYIYICMYVFVHFFNYLFIYLYLSICNVYLSLHGYIYVHDLDVCVCM